MTLARIPNDAAAGAEIDDTFSTGVSESEGGISGRVTKRNQRIRVFNLTILPDDVAEVLAIHDTHRARWPVAVRDWRRFTFEDEPITGGYDDGTYYYAPLQRKIMPSTGTRFHYQRILVPDEDDEDIVISVGGSPLSRSAWVFDPLQSGVAKIPIGMVATSPSAVAITATGSDLVPACFTGDSLTTTVHLAQTGQDPVLTIQECRLREILEDELTALLAQTDDSG